MSAASADFVFLVQEYECNYFISNRPKEKQFFATCTHPRRMQFHQIVTITNSKGSSGTQKKYWTCANCFVKRMFRYWVVFGNGYSPRPPFHESYFIFITALYCSTCPGTATGNAFFDSTSLQLPYIYYIRSMNIG
jgi:hypothetical protein